jgi:hypothetical protein
MGTLRCPDAFLDRLASPVAIPEVSVLGTAWRAGAQPAMQPAPLSAVNGRALAWGRRGHDAPMAKNSM